MQTKYSNTLTWIQSCLPPKVSWNYTNKITTLDEMSLDTMLLLYPANAPDPFKSVSYERTKRVRCGHLNAPHSHVQA